jgi:hypothetical protein
MILMSQIASFYLLPAHEIESLISAATAGGIWDFLSVHAEELEEFFGSGSLFLDLDLFLMDAQTMLFNLAAKDWSNHLSHIHGSYKALFDHRAAQKAITVLTETDWNDAAIRRFYEGEGHTEVDEELIEAFRSARDHALIWMSGVEQGSFGLLSIG